MQLIAVTEQNIDFTIRWWGWVQDQAVASFGCRISDFLGCAWGLLGLRFDNGGVHNIPGAKTLE